jgi:hypothetical protein
MSISVSNFSIEALNHYSMPTILGAIKMLEWIEADCKDYDLINRFFMLAVANNSLFVDRDYGVNELLRLEACLTLSYPMGQISEFKAFAQGIKTVPNFYQMPTETQVRFWNDKCKLGERKYLAPYKY